MKLPPLDYIRPGTVTEALKVWSDREVMFLAGGQGLLSEMGQGLRRRATLADISAIPELGTIEITADGSMLRAGAAVPLGQLAGHPALRGSLLAAAARHVGVPPIRALATVGGNFCHGHPTSELPLAALVAGASLVGYRRDGTEARFTGPELAALRPAGDRSEVLLTALEWPVHSNGHARRIRRARGTALLGSRCRRGLAGRSPGHPGATHPAGPYRGGATRRRQVPAQPGGGNPLHGRVGRTGRRLHRLRRRQDRPAG